MAATTTSTDTNIFGIEAFGVRMWLAANRPEAVERLPELFPPGSRPFPVEKADHRLAIIADKRGTYAVDGGGALLMENASLELALESLDAVVRARVALHSPDRIFVHAGVVAYGDRTIVIPGSSFTGKTSLVAALVREGAIYYSDEYAPLDADGLVHPYPKPLSLRGDDKLQSDHHVESLGGVAGEEPLPIGLVVAATYRPGVEWRPERLSPGEGVLELLANTVPARTRPEQSMRAISRAVEGVVVLKGDRGEAAELAPRLMEELASEPSRPRPAFRLEPSSRPQAG